MPTPDPSTLPNAVTLTAAVFTSNYSLILTAVLALVALITVPLIVIRGGLRWAVGGIRRLFARV